MLLFAAGYYCAYIAIEVTYRGCSCVLIGICGGGLTIILIDKINDCLS